MIIMIEENDANLMMPGRAYVPTGSKTEQVKDGGPGSGNFGHAGRPGEVGGSGPGGGSGKSERSAFDLPKVGERTLSSSLLGGKPEYHTPESVKKFASDRAHAETVDRAAKEYGSKALSETKHEAIPGGHHYIEGKHGLIMGSTKAEAEAEYRRKAESAYRTEERKSRLK